MANVGWRAAVGALLVYCYVICVGDESVDLGAHISDNNEMVYLSLASAC